MNCPVCDKPMEFYAKVKEPNVYKRWTCKRCKVDVSSDDTHQAAKLNRVVPLSEFEEMPE